MNKLSRRFRQLFAKSSRRSRQRRGNRLLHSEQLEGRVLLAANILHNQLTAEDVNNDGHVVAGDVLAVVNALKSGSHQSEGEDGSPMYYDVNDDGSLAPSDALAVINKILRAEGENPAQIVSYEPVALASTFINAPSFGGFSFVDNGANDSIVINGNGRSWVDAGFTVGGTVLVSDSGVFVDTVENPPVPDEDRNFELDRHIHNNGVFDIVGVTADTLTVAGNLTTVYPSDVRTTDQTGSSLAGQDFISQSALFFRPVTSVGTGSDFFLGMLVQDLRTETETGQPLPSASKGVFSGTVDVVFDTDKVTANGTSNSNILLHNNFSTRSTAIGGTFGTAGLIDEAGASAFGSGVGVPTGGNQQLLFRTSFTAGTMPGTTTLSTDSAEQSPANDTLLFGINAAIPTSMISYGTLDLQVASDVIAEDDLANGQAIVTVSEGTAAVEVPVLNNDQVLVPTGGTPTITAVTQPAGGAAEGSVTFNASQLFYTPPASVSNPTDVMFTYTISNGQGATDSATVTVRVNPVNDAPTIAAPANVTATEDTLLNISGVSVADPDDNSLTVTLSVSNGSLGAGTETGGSITLTGTPATVNSALSGLTYTPNADVDTSDTLAIGVSDGIAATVTANVAIGITAVDDATELTVPIDQTVFLGADLIFNTSNSNAISLVDVDSTLSVTLSLDAAKDGNLAAGGQSGKSITLTGSASAVTSQLDGLTFSHTATLPFDTTLTVTSVDGTTVSDTVNISVAPLQTPFAANNSYSADEGTSSFVLDPNPLDNDIVFATGTKTLTEINGTTLVVDQAFATTAAGSVAFDGTSFTYTPPSDPDFFGTDTFTYTIEDSTTPLGDDNDGPSEGTVTIEIQPINDGPVNYIGGAPISTSPSVSGTEDTTLSFSSGNALTISDIDAGTGDLTVTLTVTTGTLNVSSTGGVQGNGGNQLT